MSFVPPPAPTGTSFDTPRPTEPAPPPPTIPPEALVYRETVPGGAMASLVVRRGQTLRLTAVEAGANLGMVCYHRWDPLDRYNMADTLKAQHTAKLTAGYLLLTDMGRALFSITGDTLGWHDPLGGHDNAALVQRKWGGVGFQEARNRYQRNAHDCFLIELGKWGLGRRDLVANINWFSKISVDAAGHMAWVPGHARAATVWTCARSWMSWWSSTPANTRWIAVPTIPSRCNSKSGRPPHPAPMTTAATTVRRTPGRSGTAR